MKRKEIEEIEKLNPYSASTDQTQPNYPPQNAHNSILPLTDWDRWKMAVVLDVPLEIIRRTEKNFWEYVKDPNKRRKYKTSYLTIKKWIAMDLKRGIIQNCSETDRLKLATEDPNTQKLIQETFEFGKAK